MKSFSQANKPIGANLKKGFVPLVLLGIGLLLIALQFLSNLGNYTKTMFVHTEHPLGYRYTIYDALLKTYIKDGLVDYRGLKQSSRLLKAVSELEHISPDKIIDSRDKLAFWINAYNLLVLKTVADSYPVNNVRQIAKSLSLRKYLIGGIPYSVSDIEAMEIRPYLRSHFPQAIFLMCAGARGDPKLLNHALEGKLLITEMNQAAYVFVNNPQNVYLDTDTNTLYLSLFFKWHADFFQADFGSPYAFVNAYLQPDKQLDLTDYHLRKSFAGSFNWWLNDLALEENRQPK
ncbi:MAG: DUF547 domain-containing protein [Candidatus Melainabacteria bacterium]|nr:DUF547 domain-containing protein [Candidatus Melainabacteria bacterium]